MAFQWNWEPQPIETRLKDARSIAAAKAMEGYLPREADPRTYEATPAVLATEAMEGYVPWGANYNPQGRPTNNLPNTQPAYPGRGPQQYDNLGQGVIYQQQQEQAQAQLEQAQAQLEALRAEYAANAQKIQQLKMELVSLNETSGKYMDDLDMRLAANRAGIGDMGTAMAHQNRIITRQQLENAKNNSTSPADKAALDLVSSYIDTESAMMMGDNSQRPGFQNKLNFLQYQIDHDPKAKQLLAKFRGSTGGAPLEQSKTFQDFNNFVSDKRTGNAANPTKKNGLTKADKEAIDEYWFSLPKEVREANKEAYNAIRGEEDIETIQKRGNSLRAKQQTALNEAKNHIIPTELDDKGSQEYTASNGQKVNITRSGFGKAVLSIGKLVETVNY